MNYLFAEVAAHSVKKHGVIRSVKRWQKNFTCITVEYFNILKLKNSSRDSDDLDLYDKPEFIDKMYEIERNNARHDDPKTVL